CFRIRAHRAPQQTALPRAASPRAGSCSPASRGKGRTRAPRRRGRGARSRARSPPAPARAWARGIPATRRTRCRLSRSRRNRLERARAPPSWQTATPAVRREPRDRPEPRPAKPLLDPSAAVVPSPGTMRARSAVRAPRARRVTGPARAHRRRTRRGLTARHRCATLATLAAIHRRHVALLRVVVHDLDNARSGRVERDAITSRELSGVLERPRLVVHGHESRL